MNLVLTVLQIVSPVFLLAAVGFAWVRLGFEYRIEFVTRLAMTLGVPCLVFTALMKADIEPAALSSMALAAIATYLAITAAMWALVRVFRLDTRTYLAPMTFGNTGNLGLPLALFAFGNDGLGFAVLFFAVTSVYAFTFGVWLVSGGGSALKVVQEPLVGATLLGALFLWQGWQTPLFLTRGLELIGQMAIPLMLITLGVALARLAPRRLLRPVALSLAKAAVCFAIALAVGTWMALDRVPFGILLLQATTPVAVTSYLLAEKYGADSESVAGLVVVSTLTSVIVLPLVLAFVI